ncbi:MAG: tRNA preQ1(34) S-adenosylmethionine ribosyltransferase-isomerase QueA [bacterium]
MQLKQFDYNLPKELIATEPASPRDAADLLAYDIKSKKCIHEKFYNIGKFLKKGDVLVLNDTRVIPARLLGRRVIASPVLGARQSQPLGRKFKILLLEKITPPHLPLIKGRKGGVWTCLIDGRGREAGLKLYFSKNLRGEVIKKIGNGIWEIKFNKSGKALDNLIFKLGEMPLPPYIKQGGYRKENKDWYQTVFAKYAGSVAAPTAGLHFTPRLLSQLKKQGVKIEYVTLHVGMGTFMPVKTEKIEEHKMHKELAIISPKTAAALNKAKKAGGRIVACGTTAARTLESFALFCCHCEPRNRGVAISNIGKIASSASTPPRNDRYFIRAGKKYTDIFIYPPYKFKFVDALITNFHLPKSTLLMMVAAFLSEGDKKGIEKVKELYAEAIKKKYRFYSYGDAMLII